RNNRTRIAEFLVGKRGAVFVFLAPDCPLSQGYTSTLNRLHEQFQPSGIAFYGVFSGNASKQKTLEDFVTTYKVEFPSVPDEDLSLADFFGATKTPEVFAVDAGGKAFYQGAIDNWAPDVTTRRTVITEHHLLNALTGFLDNRALRFKRTETVGCF